MDRSGSYHRGHHNRRSKARHRRPDSCPAVRKYTSPSRVARHFSISCPGRSSRGGGSPATYHGAVTHTGGTTHPRPSPGTYHILGDSRLYAAPSSECRRGFYRSSPSVYRTPCRSRHADGSAHWPPGLSGRHLGSHSSYRYRPQSGPSSRDSACLQSGPSQRRSSGPSRGPMGGVPRTSAPRSAAHAGH